jgi:fibronectin type 3 domain-containing protein
VQRFFVFAAAVAAAFVCGIPAASPSDGSGFFVGFSEDLPKQVGSTAVTPARQLGAGAFRFTLQWSPGTTVLSSADAAALGKAVTAASGSGMRTVLAVYGTAGTSAPVDATARTTYCGYVKDALQRFPAVRDVVIWNEPNKRLFWNPQTDAPAQYEALLARCYDVLHAAYPGVNVVGLALSSTGNDDAASISPGAFIRRTGDAYRASGRNAPLLDTVGFHPYAKTAGERPWLKHVGQTTIGEGDWNKLMYNLWLAFDGTPQPLPGAGARLWYLEDGFQTTVPAAKASAYTGAENVATIPDWAGGEPDSPAPAATSTAPDQATQVLDAIRLAACQPTVGAFFNFLLADEPILTGWQSGALFADLTPKASYGSVQQAIAAATSGSVDCAALKGGLPSADFMPPVPPTGLAAQAAPNSVTLTWSAATDDSGDPPSYRVYRNGSFVATTAATTWTTTSVTVGSTYTFVVRGIDAQSNVGDPSNAVSVAVPAPDTTAPAAPTGLTAVQQGVAAQLAWAAGTDGVTAYEVSRDGVVLGTTASPSFTDATIAANRTYGYSVVALDAAANRSPAATVSLTTVDVTPPSAVTGLAATGADAPPRVTLTWQPATDDVAVTAYDVYRGATLVTSTTATTATDTAVAAGQSYGYSVRARDAAGNAGPVVTATVAIPDTTAPSVPTGVRATVTRTRVTLTWQASTDNVAVAGYRVYRDGTPIATTAATSYVDSSTAIRQTYRYTVAAYDAAGNASAQSGSVMARTGSVASLADVTSALRPDAVAADSTGSERPPLPG